MNYRTASIVIDDFLDKNKWEYIQNNLIDYLHTTDFKEDKNGPYTESIKWIKDRLKNLNIWREHWENTIDMWSYINSTPSGTNRESSSTNGGYHSEFGGFVAFHEKTIPELRMNRLEDEWAILIKKGALGANFFESQNFSGHLVLRSWKNA